MGCLQQMCDNQQWSKTLLARAACLCLHLCSCLPAAAVLADLLRYCALDFYDLQNLLAAVVVGVVAAAALHLEQSPSQLLELVRALVAR